MRSLVEQSGLLGSLRQKSFENYFPRTRKQKDALAKVKAGGSFFIIGPWGTGKSHLLAASVSDALNERDSRCVLLCSVVDEDDPRGCPERWCE